ncbi:MAG: GNAT family N-acetyltransferase [Candidatus Saccharimonadales bacterium]|nr:GNAT family N-acetyltransferase [Candidatus Saccharibacteria bacterium]
MMSVKAVPNTNYVLEEVNPENRRIYDIEQAVVLTSPNVFDTGGHENFIRFIRRGGLPKTYILNGERGMTSGYIALSILHEQKITEVRSIAVLPRYQSRGYGGLMMKEAERIAHEAGCGKMTLAANPKNKRATRFYKNLGYEVVATVDNYFGDGTPRFIFNKTLPN